MKIQNNKHHIRRHIVPPAFAISNQSKKYDTKKVQAHQNAYCLKWTFAKQIETLVKFISRYGNTCIADNLIKSVFE
jgi:hypothetical protein